MRRRRMPEDIRREGLPATAGPLRSRRIEASKLLAPSPVQPPPESGEEPFSSGDQGSEASSRPDSQSSSEPSLTPSNSGVEK